MAKGNRGKGNGNNHRKGAPIKKVSAASSSSSSSSSSSKSKRGRDDGSAKPGNNPFDERSNARMRHEVVNRRVKGAVRNVGKARSAAYEKRTKTLLVEHQNRRSASSFVDRRFGEGDQSMSVEGRMYEERFKRED